MEITADLVKDLREKSGARMMDCKKALSETMAFAAKGRDTWMAAAEIWLRKKSLVQGSTMSVKTATEGLLGHKLAPDGHALTVVEMTANTDFVAKNPEFLAILKELVELADSKQLADAAQLSQQPLRGTTVA
jgi:elongation factor Ts